MRAPWSRREIAALIGVVALGIVLRVVLLPTEGFRDDMDQFVGWVHQIATNGLGALYDQTAAGPVTFGPVMGYVWMALAAIDPGFQTATDASATDIRILMKLPASIADLGIALLIGYALRARPQWAVAGAALILLHPAVIDVSAWWGQYESVYMLSALAATILAINGRNRWAAAMIAVSLLTKPQALPMLLPFAAWFWAAGGWRGLARATAIGSTVGVVLWLPFISADGPANYIANLGQYQGDIFAFLSLRAWNLWWLVQEAAGGGFVRDNVPFLGPITWRHVGYASAGMLELIAAMAVLRDPRPRTLIVALAATVLVAFSLLTTMHERYAYGALVLLALVVAEPGLRRLSLAFGIVFTMNLLAAIPPTRAIGELLPVGGLLGAVGSVAMLAVTFATLRQLPGSEGNV